MRLGSWQRSVLATAQRAEGTPIPYHHLQPRGRAQQYAGGYHRRFLALAEVPGVTIGPLGPRGGLAIVYTTGR